MDSVLSGSGDGVGSVFSGSSSGGGVGSVSCAGGGACSGSCVRAATSGVGAGSSADPAGFGEAVSVVSCSRLSGVLPDCAF